MSKFNNKTEFSYEVAPIIMHGTEEPASCRPYLFFSYKLLLCLEKKLAHHDLLLSQVVGWVWDWL